MPDEAFFRLHREMPRQGPGSAAEVDWVLGRIPPPARVIDAACGPGADTETLADRLPGARIEGVDITSHFVSEAAARLARFGDRVTVREGDLRELTGPADLIWCMGALYNLGIDVALKAWRPVLAPGGHVAFSHPIFLNEPPSDIEAEFWSDPIEVTTGDKVANFVGLLGYRTIATRVLTGAPWAEYYLPMEARIAALRPDADPALARVLDVAEREIALWRQAPDQIAFLLTLATPA